MKKVVLSFVAFATVVALNGQISRPGSSTIDSKIAEFTKLVTACTSGQRVNQEKLTALYDGINCSLTEAQSEALLLDLANTREETCGSSVFPTTQAISDASFKKYAEQVEKYRSCKK